MKIDLTEVIRQKIQQKTKHASKHVRQFPGNVVYVGKEHTSERKILMMDFNEGLCDVKKVDDIASCSQRQDSLVRWIDFIGVDQIQKIEQLGTAFSFHPLVLEDVANTQQRPKLEEFEDYLFVSLKLFTFDELTKELQEEQISIILGTNYVISFQEREGDDFQIIKERIKNGKGRIRKMGSDYLFYSLVDAIVDSYYLVLEAIEDEIEILQEELITNPTKKTLPKIQQLKQQLISLRKSIWPVREIVGNIQRTDSDLISDSLSAYLRDVYDHTVQIIDTLETYRDILAGSLDIYLSTISNRMNEVMKVLTIIGTIFIPLTFAVGIYGMNFKYMPELESKIAYPILWGIMLSVAGGMLLYFRKRKWL